MRVWVSSCHLECARELIGAGASLEARNLNGRTPLHLVRPSDASTRNRPS